MIEKNKTLFKNASNEFVRGGLGGEIKLRLDAWNVLRVQFRTQGQSGVILEQG